MSTGKPSAAELVSASVGGCGVNARNKLAEYLAPHVPELPWLESGHLAVAHIEGTLGWRRPARTLNTYDELDALSAMDPNAVVMWIDGDGITHATEAFTASCMDRPITWPATVLWESGDPR